MVQNLCATFGPPTRIDLDTWKKTPIWTDASTCTISMHDWPRGGAGFPDMDVSEEGRQFLATRLSRLSSQQIRELFEGARVPSYPHANPLARDADRWVRAFEEKVHAIADRPLCPHVR